MNDLFDFLTFLHRGRDAGASRLQFATDAKAAFYRYLDRREIEICNFGAFRFDDGVSSVEHHAGSNMPQSWFDEYYGEGYDRDDYVFIGADRLSASHPLKRFRVDGAVADRISDTLPASARVIRQAKDYGLESAHVIVGRTAIGHAQDQERLFAFIFGGKNDSAERTGELIFELEIAAMALLDKLEPEFLARGDGIDPCLTPRELDTLRLTAEGAHRADVAHRLGISVATVDLHLANLRKRLGVRTLAEAVARGYRYGLI